VEGLSLLRFWRGSDSAKRKRWRIWYYNRSTT
jgi:hypothetical protein